ncbi:DUF559 domain-containing protein [Diaminobutyricibacter tongyongensis]|uniref:DUF559 domain-containing protein n=1 Tax=Leifsonia tongyongensis TaxID=1268043 RepID=A0A6L9Y388_9MICO|nr:DUF559 domain-containing protein [Diaminobutyricibacter tongyongensis]NEN07867.1 DUF559 domain-containing protein [Diaminobutyricibacter tongyongensis]
MRRPTPLPDRYEDAPFALRTALQEGLTVRRLQGRDLRRPFRGVRVHASAPDSLQARCAAYGQRMPVGGFFSCTTAALLHGIPLPLRFATDERIHVSVPHPARAPRVKGVVAHSVRIAEHELTTLADLPLSTPSRTWCELGALLDVASLVAAGDHLVHQAHGSTTVAGLAGALDAYPGSRGRTRLREALPLLHDRSESPQESVLRLMLLKAGLSRLSVNHEITTLSGHRFRADLAFAEERVLLEYQGDHHRERDQYRRDLTRTMRLQAEGWTVVQIGPDDLRLPEDLVSRIRSILGARTLTSIQSAVSPRTGRK